MHRVVWASKKKGSIKKKKRNLYESELQEGPPPQGACQQGLDDASCGGLCPLGRSKD